ncbi:MFS general substrate transporter [Thozetella sp. PMI_491]|nr:MFS general substrate transporter [Thozetella sp. PMI_491]
MAWLQAVLMHLVFFNTWGLANGFGMFQQYYSSTLGESQSSISWIGTVQVFLLFLVGVAAGRLTDAGYFRAVFAVGVVLQLCGIFLTSLCSTYWQIFLAQAVAVGLGNGCTFCPALSILSSYFNKNRALAVGIAAAGAGTGGLVYPVIVNQLINRAGYGFPWALRIMGFVMLATSLPCLIWFTPRVPPRRTGPLIDKSAFRELPFVFFSLSMFLNFWGLYFVFFYLGTFARDHIGIAEPVNLIMILNGVGIVGRIIPGIVAARWTGSLNLLIPLSFTTALLVYCWAAIHTESALTAFAVIYGFFAAALQSLFPAVATTMTPDINRTGTRVGMIFSIVSFATLTGPSISGALIQKSQGSYLGAQIFAGTCILLGACAAAAARIATRSTQSQATK